MRFPKKPYISKEGKDIIYRLLQKDPQKRLGSKGIEEIKQHPWFNQINWDLL